MTRIAEIPASFDDKSFDQFAAGFGAWPPEERMLFDARAATWASPYGLIGMLTAGQALREAHREKPLFTVPASDEVRRYWAKTGFFRHAADLFEIHGKVPRIAAVGRFPTTCSISRRSAHRKTYTRWWAESRNGPPGCSARSSGSRRRPRWDSRWRFRRHVRILWSMPGRPGWVAVHLYNFRKRLGRRVIVIAVSDAGLGFRRSLEATQAKRFGDRWGDAAALEAALIQGVSRFRDPGRGQGLAGIKRYLTRWDGKISIRSGTARLSIVPKWDDDVPLAENLPFFPGSQVQVVIPAQEGGAR